MKLRTQNQGCWLLIHGQLCHGLMRAWCDALSFNRADFAVWTAPETTGPVTPGHHRQLDAFLYNRKLKKKGSRPINSTLAWKRIRELIEGPKSFLASWHLIQRQVLQHCFKFSSVLHHLLSRKQHAESNALEIINIGCLLAKPENCIATFSPPSMLQIISDVYQEMLLCEKDFHYSPNHWFIVFLVFLRSENWAAKCHWGIFYLMTIAGEIGLT